MSYLERLKKLDTPTIGGVISIKRPSDTFDTSYRSHIPENQFLADSEVKRNQSRCSDCINLNPCPSARNIKGQCPINFTKRKNDE